VMGKQRGHAPPAPPHAGLAFGSISSNFFPIFGDLPSEHVNLGLPRAHFCETEVARDASPRWGPWCKKRPSRQGEVGP